MTAEFIGQDFLLQTETARLLYHQYACNMPIYDYHCHLPADKIAADCQFDNLTQVWLSVEHYKWRAMRANGIPEKYITGSASDYEKFEKWAQTVPCTLRNPLYHWTHLELARYFNITAPLGPDTAKQIYDSCSEMLRSPQFNVRNLLRKTNVALVCTTEDPLDNLQHHKKIRQDGYSIKVYPTFRPDAAMAAEDVITLNEWIDSLEAACDTSISNFTSYIEAICKRHDYFHENGCRTSDHGLDTAYAEDYSNSQIEKIFAKLRSRSQLDSSECLKFKSAMMLEFARLDCEKGWVMQLHIGALRNPNTRMMKTIGPDAGFDAISDWPQAAALAGFLDRLDARGILPKTILYNLNPADNEVFAAIAGSFQNGSVPGKIQYGPAWWFLDHKDGIENQIAALSNTGLLSHFIGMVTDSRSFLSLPRHEYFRRILCNILGNDVKNNLLPNDPQLLGTMVQDICFNNARNYFTMPCPLIRAGNIPG
jgi:glucuronate isomerase